MDAIHNAAEKVKEFAQDVAEKVTGNRPLEEVEKDVKVHEGVDSRTGTEVRIKELPETEGNECVRITEITPPSEQK